MRSIMISLVCTLSVLALAGAAPSADTQYAGVITQSIDTANAYVGQPITLRDVISEDGNVTGAMLTGRVEHVVSAAQGRRAELEMIFTKLTLSDGAQYAVDGVVTGMQANTKSNAGREILGTVAGVLVGNIIAKSIFHASGGAGGFLGAAGGYLIASNMKENMVVPNDSVVRVTLKSLRRQAP